MTSQRDPLELLRLARPSELQSIPAVDLGQDRRARNIYERVTATPSLDRSAPAVRHPHLRRGVTLAALAITVISALVLAHGIAGRSTERHAQHEAHPHY